VASLYWRARAFARSVAQIDHAIVYAIDSSRRRQEGPAAPSTSRSALTIIRLEAGDQQAIEALAHGDPWGTGSQISIDELGSGHICYFAKLGDQVVAATWLCVKTEYHDAYLDRALALAPDEAYYFRTFTLQRGRGILPVLRVLDYAVGSTSAGLGKRSHFGIVNPGNEPMHMLLNHLGWKRVGHIGFVDMLGLRVNYVWGRDAFPRTRPRLRLSASRFPSLRPR
jgi:hypothetical protein